MKIGMDIDGVLYKWIPTARYLIEAQFGIKVPESKHWDTIKESIPAEAWRWLWAAGVERGLFRHGNAYKGSFDAMDAIVAQGHILHLCTYRPERARQDTEDWVAFHRIPHSGLHILDSKVPKSSLKCDLYVDDKPENIADVVSHGYKGLLWNRPWNYAERGYERISSWKGLLHYLETLR
jgi:5'(3')-deoxyribonucleotidase